MPSTATHDAIGYVTAVPIGTSACLVAGVEPAAVLTVSYVITTLLLSPDLDWGQNGKQGRVARRWGFFAFIWWPYHWLIPHRSKYSHSSWGGAFRLLYVITLIWLAFLFLFKLDLSGPLISHFIIPVGIGAMLSSFVHSLTDRIVTGSKRIKRRLR